MNWLEELSELEQKATPGEWYLGRNSELFGQRIQSDARLRVIANCPGEDDTPNAELITTLRNSATHLIERARRAEELEREVEQLRERERQQRKQLNHIEAYCEDYARDITTSHKMMREICEVVGVEQGPDR